MAQKEMAQQMIRRQSKQQSTRCQMAGQYTSRQGPMSYHHRSHSVAAKYVCWVQASGAAYYFQQALKEHRPSPSRQIFVQLNPSGFSLRIQPIAATRQQTVSRSIHRTTSCCAIFLSRISMDGRSKSLSQQLHRPPIAGRRWITSRSRNVNRAYTCREAMTRMWCKV